MSTEKLPGDQPMTEAQRDFLQILADKTGIALDPNLTKAQASQLIQELKNKAREKRNNAKKTEAKPEGERKSKKPAEPMTDAQRAFLEDLCIKAFEDFDPNWTKFQASKKISELKRRLA